MIFETNKTAAATLESVLDATIEDHAALIKSLVGHNDNEYIGNSFEPILVKNLDKLFQETKDEELRGCLLLKACYRYGYQTIEMRDGVDQLMHPAPSQIVNIWWPDHLLPF